VRWSRLMIYLFNSFEVKSIVNGQLVCPDPVCNPVSAKNWMYNDNYAQMLITANISENIMVHTNGCPTTFNMWETLRALFKRSPNMDYTKQLHTIFENCTYEGSNIVDHLTKLKSDWNNIPIHLNCYSSFDLSSIYAVKYHLTTHIRLYQPSFLISTIPSPLYHFPALLDYLLSRYTAVIT